MRRVMANSAITRCQTPDVAEADMSGSCYLPRSGETLRTCPKRVSAARGGPRAPGCEALGSRRVAEQEQVDEPRRREVAQVPPRQVDVRALERGEVVRELERPAVGAPLEPPRP